MRQHIHKQSWNGKLSRFILLCLTAFFVAVACGDDSDTDAIQTAGSEASTDTAQAASEPGRTIQVVTTTNFVADWVENIGGSRVEAFSLLPLGSDPHSFQPGARDVAKIADADLVLTIGLGLEAGWLTELVHNANTDETKVIALGDFIDPIEFEESGGHDNEDEDHPQEDGQEENGEDHGLLDPHFWFDPVRVQTVVNEIADRLSVVDPTGEDIYSANAAKYNASLDELHAWTQEQVAQIPVKNRLIVTSHDSLSYFAELYGFLMVGAVIPTSLSLDVEPTAEHMTDLVHEIEEYGVSAVFGETTASERLANAIAEETGASLVRLYSGSLGPEGSGAETYIGMQRLNVERIVEALK